MVGPPQPQPLGVGDVVGGHLGRELLRRHAGGPRRLVDLVVDVGDVGHQHRLEPLVLRGSASAARRRRTAARCRRGRASRPSGRRRRCRPARGHAVAVSGPGQIGSHAGKSSARCGTLARKDRPVRVASCAVSALAEVQEAFRTLPERYLGAERDFDATYHIRLGDIGHTWEVRCTTHGARVRAGVTGRDADVVIGTDAETWLRLRRGDLSGVEAFSQRLLYARGDLDLAVGFEGMFRLPSGRPPLVRIHDVVLEHGTRVSTLTMGEGPDVLLLHGLGATKTSFFDTVRGAQPLLPRPRARPAGLRRLEQARAGPLRRAVVRPRDARGDGRAADRARAPDRQLDGRPRRARGRAARARPRRRPGAAVPRAGVRAPRLPAARAAAAAGARPAAALARPRPHRAPVLVDVRRPRPRRPQRGRHRRRRVRAHLPQRRRPPRLPLQRALDLPRPAVRPHGPVPAPGGARAARDVRVGLARQADPARLQPPRRALAPRRRADHPRGLRPRPAGRGARAHERPAHAVLRADRRARRRRRRSRVAAA